MKKILVACLLALFALSAFAAPVPLKPYFPSPFAGAPFSLPSLCHVQSFDSAGNASGVCRYYGYGANAYAIVTWNSAGAPVSAAACVLYAFQNQSEPVCPAQLFGPLEYIDGIWVFVQATGAAGERAVILDQVPHTSALIPAG